MLEIANILKNNFAASRMQFFLLTRKDWEEARATAAKATFDPVSEIRPDRPITTGGQQVQRALSSGTSEKVHASSTAHLKVLETIKFPFSQQLARIAC